MLSSQEEQAERRRVFAQDQSLPRQATTMHAFAQAERQRPEVGSALSMHKRLSALVQSRTIRPQPRTNAILADKNRRLATELTILSRRLYSLLWLK
jgi:hypothetical protein